MFEDDFALARAWDSAMSSLDADAAAELCTDDIAYRDHRPLGWGALDGREAVRELYRSVVSGVKRFVVVSEVIDVVDDRVLIRQNTRFAVVDSDGGGTGEIEMFVITRRCDGRMAEADIFADEAAARASLGVQA